MNLLRLGKVSLALVVLLLGACTKDSKDAPQTQERHYAQMSISLELDTQVEAFSNQTPQESGARAATFDMGTKGSLTSPKFKELEDGTKLLCIIRSSNADQPINYVQAVWKRSGDRYYLKYEDGKFPFQYDASKPLGTLYAMLVAGGEWDATNKRLSFSNRITPIKTVGGKEVATLDVPYFSAWEELEAQTPDPAGLAVRLKDYKTGLSTEPAFVLKPQGMLLRMRVENEMENPVNGKLRAAKLNKLYVRSTAYSGDGYYDLSEAQVRAGATKTAKTRNEQLLPWTFSDADALKTTIFTFSTPLELSTDATSTTPAGSVRGMKDYPNSPWVLAWVKATDQPASLVGQVENNLPKVRTEILAEVEDSRSNTVYSNKEGVDAEEATGKIVVPSMKALPVYSSMLLTTKSGANAAFVNGAAYSLTINVQRMPLLLERISEYEVKQSGSAFTDKRYTDVGYFSRAELMTGSNPNPNKIPLIGNKANTTWDYPDFELTASIMGINHAASWLGTVSLDDTKLKYPTILPADGNYKPYSNSVRFWLGLTHKEVNGKMEAYTLAFYPNERAGTDKTARYTSIVKYEYDRTDNNGLVIMKMTQRYLGAYSLWAAHFPDNTPTAEYKPRLVQDMERIMKLGDAFWNDPLRKADDIVRYFPLLGYKETSGSPIQDYGVNGFTIMGITGGNNKYGNAAYSTSLLTHHPAGTSIFANDAYLYSIPLRLVRQSFK